MLISGTLQWQKILGGSGTEIANSVAIDSSDNIIVGGYTSSDGAGGNDFLIAKYNSSGTLQWDRTLGGSSNDLLNHVAVDASDNIFAVGYTASDGAGGFDCLIAKYNSSGTLQWDRTLGGSDYDELFGVAIDSNGNVIVCGMTDSDGDASGSMIVAKVPSDGSLEGTYGPFTYEEAVLTDAAAVLTAGTGTSTDSSGGFSDAAAVLTETSSYTLYTIS